MGEENTPESFQAAYQYAVKELHAERAAHEAERG